MQQVFLRNAPLIKPLWRATNICWRSVATSKKIRKLIGNPKRREKTCRKKCCRTVLPNNPRKYCNTEEIPADCFRKRSVLQSSFEMLLSFFFCGFFVSDTLWTYAPEPFPISAYIPPISASSAHATSSGVSTPSSCLQAPKS